MALSVAIEKQLGSFRLKVDFEAETEVLSLLGASGCGKSMTLKCIAGIETPDRGKIVLDGRTLFDSEKKINLPPQARRVGYLFQQYALFPNMTLMQNVLCGVRSGGDRKQRAREIISLMQLEGLEQKKPWQLSGGQQQRTALARILVNEPDVLLLDEPFSALDSHLRFQLERNLRQVIGQFGKPVIFVSHDRDEVFRLSDRIAVMEQGRIDAIGSKASVFQAPRTPKGAVLTGCKNISPARRIDDTHVYATDWNLTLTVPSVPERINHVGIRMHDISLQPGDNQVACQLQEEIENPFSYTLMLEPEGAQSPIGMELSKEDWLRHRQERLTISIPKNSILLLEDHIYE